MRDRFTGKPLGTRRLLRTGWRLGLITFLVVSPVMVTIGLVSSHGFFLLDYRGDLHDGARAILAGHDPYPVQFIAKMAAYTRGGGTARAGFAVPVYPPPSMLAVLPLSVLPYQVGGAVFILVSVVALLVSLRLLGVRDWRCYGVALVSWPVLFGLYLGALDALLLLGLAVVWRWRDGLVAPATGIAAVVAAKLFAWPIAVWALITKRFRMFGLAVLIGAAMLLVGWAAIGFAGLTSYPKLLSDLTYIEARWGSSTVAALLALGLPYRLAEGIAIAAGAILLLLAWRLRGRADGDRRAYGLAVMAALVASPLAWGHYLTLLIIPIALISPRLSPVWFVPLLSDFAPDPQFPYHPWRMVPYAVISLIVIARLCARLPLAQPAHAHVGGLRRLLGPRGRAVELAAPASAMAE